MGNVFTLKIHLQKSVFVVSGGLELVVINVTAQILIIKIMNISAATMDNVIRKQEYALAA